MDRPFRARDCTPSLIGEATSREGGKSFRNPPPPVTTSFLSIDRSGLTHPISRVNSPRSSIYR